MENLYYQSSGKAPFTAVITSLLLSSIAGFLLAIVYIALQWFIPIIYFNFLITLGLAYAIFYTVNFFHKSSKIRNVNVSVGTTLIVSCIAFYTQWALFVALMFESDGTMGGGAWVKSSFNFDGFWFFLSHPDLLWEEIKLWNEYGTFSLKSSVVSGTFLWVLWAIEAAVILVWPAILMRGGRASKPFSETDNEWMDERKLDAVFPYIQDKDVLLKHLQSGNFDPIQVPLPKEEISQQYAVVTAYDGMQDDFQYINVQNMTEEINKKGELKIKEKLILEYFKIPKNTV